MENTPEVILKLSNLLDYLLYQTNKPLVGLESEFTHLRDYVALEKIRFRDTLTVDVDFETINDEISLPPMLFLPLVENAFKHGLVRDDKLQIKMQCTMEHERLYFTISNTADEANTISGGGIGLSNLRKRLKLLYPNRHSLKTDYEAGKYMAELQIDEPQRISNEEV
jgi:LytS/YehU family sensor histidine kinase